MSTINQLDADARSALSEGYVDDALRHSTRLLVRALELRVTVWEKKAKLAEEVEDALLIIKYDEDNTNAYLRVAKIYAVQGKQQDAIDMLEKGLGTSPSDEQAILLQQQLTIAKGRLNRRVDFITETPYEIACKIISSLDFDLDIGKCMNVSNTWRTVILRCPEPWQSSKITWHGNKWPWSNPSVLQEMMPLISRHIKKLDVHFPTTVPDVIRFLTDCEFSHLQYLKLVDNDQCPDLRGSLYCIFQNIGNTLKELEIEARSVTICLEDVLSNCPGLTYLSLRVEDIIAWDAKMPYTTLLEVINLFPLMQLLSHEMEPLFRCSPHLRHMGIFLTFEFEKYEDYNILSAIEPYCPELISLKNHRDYAFTMIPYELPVDEDASEGLRLLSLADIRSIIPFTPQLMKSFSTLRSITVFPVAGGMESDLTDWEPLSSAVMHNLTHLSISADLNSTLYQHLPAMIRSYPALKSIYLGGEESTAPSETTDRIFDAVAELASLTNLNLEGFCDMGSGFARLIQHYATRPTLLKELSVANVDMDIQVLYSIAQIQSLQHLLVHIPYGREYTEADIVEFTRFIAQIPGLKILDIHGMELTKDAVANIASSQSLVKLELCDCGESLEGSVYRMIENLL
ncbi:hypothetical protein BJV82DRAFT_673770 [Fennellomyces sp. T-0311]|nr:hypothetical protein BJV82DRAFT_673770 [Fennellomyces sp. T-0311]